MDLDTGITVSAEADGFDPGARCHAVVRPEKLQVAVGDERPDADLPSVEGTVETRSTSGPRLRSPCSFPAR